jgi:hypothetical protein
MAAFWNGKPLERNMKKAITLLCLSLLFVTGCATTDPLERFYQAYNGDQQEWPTSPGTFVSDVDGIRFYHGAPQHSYRIIGRISRPNINPHKLAQCAIFHRANAVCLMEREFIGTKTDNGVLLFGKGWAVNTPQTTRPEMETITHAYLIQIDGKP